MPAALEEEISVERNGGTPHHPPAPNARGGGSNANANANATPEVVRQKSKRAAKRQRKKQTKKLVKTIFLRGDNDEIDDLEEEKESDEVETADGKDTKVKEEKEETIPRLEKPPVTKREEEEKEQVEYVFAEPDFDNNNPAYAEMKEVFERFKKLNELPPQETEEEMKENILDFSTSNQSEANEEDEGETALPTLSRRKQKQASRLTISELKQLISTPAVVEVHDVNSADPKLLVALKAYPHAVPVPSHWSAKKKYLSTKRGYEKLPFKLPDYIVNTGITKIRGVQLEKEATKKSKAKQREKMRPKMGAIDIDYQILHDAFFRYQTKPPLTEHGALYYEGREFEVRLTEKRPLIYSPQLCTAVGMAGPNSPPPWLHNMQRLGPPPSYPFLRIPGVNAPIPSNSRWGLAEGEWGKPPVDEFGKPRWGGDLFGVELKEDKQDNVDKTKWGELKEEEDEEEEEEEEMTLQPQGEEINEEEEKRNAESKAAADEEDDMTGLTSVSSIAGLTTPETLNLRKGGNIDSAGTDTPDIAGATAVRRTQLYTILEEKKAESGSGLFGTSHTYVLPSATAAATAGPNITSLNEEDLSSHSTTNKRKAGVDVVLNPEELEGLDAQSLKRKYDQQVNKAAEAAAAERAENLDGIASVGKNVEEVLAQQKKKRKTAKEKEGKKDKALKDFKF